MSEIKADRASYEPGFPGPQKGDLVGVQMPDGTIRIGTYGRPRVDELRRMQESLRSARKTFERLTKPSLWQRIRRRFR